METPYENHLSNLSSFELLELMYTVRNTMTEDFLLFITALSGILLVAHFVGASLSALQKASLVVIYTLFQLSIIFGAYVMALQMGAIQAKLSLIDEPIVHLGVLIVTLPAYLASMVFLLAKRRGDNA